MSINKDLYLWCNRTATEAYKQAKEGENNNNNNSDKKFTFTVTSFLIPPKESVETTFCLSIMSTLPPVQALFPLIYTTNVYFALLPLPVKFIVQRKKYLQQLEEQKQTEASSSSSSF